ncbi:MAG: hypothetical protein UW74_C0017G0004 [Candidatus Giovannonibacteria bacterium GW2011_GWC2_44_8]|uniref:Ada DNA repair metal-binding domain-containing protein n=1 Tax=Candidatus Giovannonibacteria bacterium GW2011_GWC2_44_8 TaxID=1618657 RepID=A0A0G1K543_9BACT|nr:MAG: hypothetical protein UW74_C0017G0004 [Candidatus Giovannonibacteria bacterium GW2011_GWC2_44_8]
MLREWLNKVKAREGDLFLIAVIILVAITGFALGRISAIKEEKFPIQISAKEAKPPLGGLASKPAVELMGSKNGTVYHLLSCSGAKSIKEENKIYFSSKEEAQKAGYRPAANCPGL